MLIRDFRYFQLFQHQHDFCLKFNDKTDFYFTYVVKSDIKHVAFCETSIETGLGLSSTNFTWSILGYFVSDENLKLEWNHRKLPIFMRHDCLKPYLKHF